MVRTRTAAEPGLSRVPVGPRGSTSFRKAMLCHHEAKASWFYCSIKIKVMQERLSQEVRTVV